MVLYLQDNSYYQQNLYNVPVPLYRESLVSSQNAEKVTHIKGSSSSDSFQSCIYMA